MPLLTWNRTAALTSKRSRQCVRLMVQATWGPAETGLGAPADEGPVPGCPSLCCCWTQKAQPWKNCQLNHTVPGRLTGPCFGLVACHNWYPDLRPPDTCLEERTPPVKRPVQKPNLGVRRPPDAAARVCGKRGEKPVSAPRGRGRRGGPPPGMLRAGGPHGAAALAECTQPQPRGILRSLNHETLNI